jgi:multiple sugar transport system ATP-binding protein
MADLVLTSINKIYRPRRKEPVHAVRDLNLTVKAGEIVALLGSSGCGKTSTLRMIAGFEDVSSGSITIGGRAIHELAPSARNVAMAFETYSLYPPLTIGDNMAFALKAARLPAPDVAVKVKAMADMLDIAGILGKYPSSVSGGQQQRASLGRALVRKADLYLLDEPMGQLEPQLRAILRGRIKHYLRENKCTSILVTHDQTEANALADRIAVMEAGLLQQYATPTDLKNNPANLFTGTFIGEPPMNVFTADVSSISNGLTFKLGGGSEISFPAADVSSDVQNLLAGKPRVILGVRPHAVVVGHGPIKAKVISCQWLGDQTHVAVEVGGRTIVSVSHDKVVEKSGSDVALSMNANDLHIFDPDSGAALAHGGTRT